MLSLVKSVDSWRAARPNSVSAQNAKAILLTRHAKSLPEDSSNRQDAVTKALEFMANHAEIGDQDPHWRATQLELLALQTVPIPNFEAMFAEELYQNPGFAPLQRSAASYLARYEPKKLSEFVLTADERFTGMTSRLFSHILHDLPRPNEADWSKIQTSYLTVMAQFPSAWNHQALAKAACTVGDFELAAKHIEKLPWLDVFWVWGTQMYHKPAGMRSSRARSGPARNRAPHNALHNRSRSVGSKVFLSWRLDVLQRLTLALPFGLGIASIYHSSLDRFRQDWHNRLPESDDVVAQLEAFEKAEELESTAAPTHWVGGHPDFVQEDVRFDPDWQEMDRVLLHLGFDNDLCLGDAGMLNVMISRRDLRNRAFDKVICTWDCS